MTDEVDQHTKDIDELKSTVKKLENENNKLRSALSPESNDINLKDQIKQHSFNELLEREPLRYCKCDGKVIFTRPFLILGKVTFDHHVNALERYWKGDISDTVTKL